jgi:hypothetical protein
VAFLARLAGVLMLGLLGACATSDSTQVSSPDSDAYNERIDEINRTWEEFRVAGNACSIDDGPCFVDAMTSSGFEQAVSDLQGTVQSFGTTVETDECRSSLSAFDAALEELLESLEAMRDDAQSTDTSGLEASVLAVRSAWDAAVTAQGATEPCFPGGLEPTTDR